MSDQQQRIQDSFDAMDAQMAILDRMREKYPEYYDHIMQQLRGYSGWQDKQLAQTMSIAQGNWKNSRYSTDMAYKTNRMQDKTTRRGQDITQENNRGTLGLGYLKAASELRGPENYFQAADFARGASARQDVPVFLQSLLTGSGSNLAAFQGPGGNPQGLNAGNLMQSLGMQTGAATANGAQASAQDQQALAGIRQLNQRGFQSLAPGSLERLTPMELGALKSGTEYGGDGGPSWDFANSVLGYQRSLPGQGSTRAA